MASKSSILRFDACKACVVGRDTRREGSASDGSFEVSSAGLGSCSGLISPSLLPLSGDVTPFPVDVCFSAPDCDPEETRFEAAAGALLVARESRLLTDRVAPPRVAAPDGWRPGLAGGPMEFLVVAVGARVLADAAAAPPRAFAGVPVRDVEALDVAVPRPSCLVGDLVGD